MKTLLPTALLIWLLAPSAVLADPLSFSGDVTLTSNYLDDGLSQTSNNPAIQPYFEIGKEGFYAGLWATNLQDEDGNRAEADLSFGYRGEVGDGIGYDVSYTQYFYDNTPGASSELGVVVDVPVTDKLTVSGEVYFDFPDNTFGETLSAEFAVTDAWTLHADVARADPLSSVNWGAGVGYALDDRTTLDLQVQDTASTSPLVALSLDYAFGDRSD
jgi:uncharacterized protein (TIGR02001 family)